MKTLLISSFAVALVAAGCDASSSNAPSATPANQMIITSAAPSPSATSASTAAAPTGPAAQPTSQPAAAAPAATASAPGTVTVYEGEGPVPNQAAATTIHYGAAFTIAAPPVALTDAISTCVDTGTPCKVSGTISKVCQNKGCWFTMTAPGVTQTIRIKMKDYGFFVPRNSVGAAIVFEGTLSKKEISQEIAQHYADDEAKAGTAPPRVVTGPELSYEFTITGAEVAMN